MNCEAMLAHPRRQHADITVAIKPVPRCEVHRFGILKQAPDGDLTAFVEKPQTAAGLSNLECSDDLERSLLASMGIYAFRTKVLMALLDSEHVDFGIDLLPTALPAYRVLGYRFEAYWEDIGTIRSLYEANLALAQADPTVASLSRLRSAVPSSATAA